MKSATVTVNPVDYKAIKRLTRRSGDMEASCSLVRSQSLFGD